MLRTGGTAAIAVLAAAMVVAGCSSSSSSSSSASSSVSSPASGSSPAGSSPAAASSPASGTGTWTIGSIGSCSGNEAASIGGTCPTIAAWAQSVNASGGIAGHKINLIGMDDNGNPATSLTDVHKLIQQDHVLAIVGDESVVDAAWAPYAQAQGVPVIGGLPVEAPFLTNPDFFDIGTNLVASEYAVAQVAAQHGAKKLGFLYCAEAPTCAQGVPLFQATATMNGASAVTDKVAATAPSYTAQCLLLKNDGVQAYEVGSDSGTVLRVLDACTAQGVTAKLVESDGTFTSSWLKDKNSDGTLGVELVAPWFDTQLPAIKQYDQAMLKYAPQVYNSALFGPNTIYAWDSGMLFEAAAKAAHLGGNPTPADVKQGLYALKNETLGGLVAPLNYTQGKPSLNSCYFPIQVRSGKFTAPAGAAPVCIPAAILAPLLKSLG